MKIVIICGCLEPGRDGVGDYVRTLASQLRLQGASCRLLALNDPYCTAASASISEQDVLRFAKEISWKSKIAQTIDHISTFEPNLISLQFVPFAYQDKGLPISIIKWLKSIRRDTNLPSTKWHLMFHELWVADEKAHSFKEMVLRESQKYLLKNLIKACTWDAIHTSNVYYQGMLARIGTQAEIFPIFSNLPKHIEKKPHSAEVTGIFFGNVQNIDSSISQLKVLKAKVKEELNRELKLIHIGGSYKQKRIQDYFNKVKNELKIPIEFKGYQKPLSASQIIARCDFGLSNYPTDLIFKSGSIAAILYNNIPVILLAPRRGYQNVHREIQTLDAIDSLAKFLEQPRGFARKYGPEQTSNALIALTN